MNKLAMVSLSLVSFVSIAAAQTPPADKKTPPAATPAAPAAKVPAAAPAAADKMAPPKAPEVPAELATLGKQMAGTWKCTGKNEIMGQMVDVKATLSHKVDANLNKMWLQTTFTGTAPKMPPMKSSWFTTYDPKAAKLWRTMINGRGGHSWAAGTIADKKITWEGDAHWADGTDVKTRTTEEMVSPKEVKVTGESSKDGGKTWTKDLEATCKK
jgi:hypothetical protein